MTRDIYKLAPLSYRTISKFKKFQNRRIEPLNVNTASIALNVWMAWKRPKSIYSGTR